MNAAVYANMIVDRQFQNPFNRPPACHLPNVSSRPQTFLSDRSRPGRRLDLVSVRSGTRSGTFCCRKHMQQSSSIPQLAESAPSRPEAERFFPTANSFTADRKNIFMCSAGSYAGTSNQLKCIRLSQTSAGRQDNVFQASQLAGQPASLPASQPAS